MAGPQGATLSQPPSGATPSVPVPEGAAPAGEMDTAQFVDRVMRMLAQGATLGFADEFAAFMRSKTEGIPYDQSLAEERGKDKAFRASNPGTALAANVVGGVVSPAAKLLAPVKGAGLLMNTGRAAVGGGIVGTATGFGEGEGTSDRLKGAGFGGATGLVAGGVTAPVVYVAGTALRGLGRFVTGKMDQKSVAARKVLKALQDDNINAQEAVKRLRELGPEAGLADVGEENVKGVARAVTSVAGPARTTGKQFLTDRQLGQGGRVEKAIRKAFGEFRKFATSADDLMAARAAAASPKYKAAYQKEVPFTEELQSILQTDAGKKAFAFAKRIASNEGRKLPDIISADGTKLNIEAVPDMRAWDIIKRAFDSVLNSHRNQVTGKLDLSDPLTFTVNEVRKRLVSELDNLNPAYKEARAVFAGPAQALSSMQRGRRFLKGDVDLTVKAIKDMSPAERDFFRLGVVRGVQDVVENTRDITDVTGRLFGSKAVRDKIRAVFPDDETFQQFEKFMKAEAVMAETRRVVLGGSPTARIQAEQHMLKQGAEIGAEAAFGSPAMVIRTLFSSLKSELSPEASEKLGQILFTKGGKVNEETVKKLFAGAKIEGIPDDLQRLLSQRIASGLAVGSSEVMAGQ